MRRRGWRGGEVKILETVHNLLAFQLLGQNVEDGGAQVIYNKD